MECTSGSRSSRSIRSQVAYLPKFQRLFFSPCGAGRWWMRVGWPSLWIFSTVVFVGCSNAQFGGNSGKKGANSSIRSNDPEAGGQDGEDGADADLNNKGGDPVTGINKGCLSRKAREYNIAIAIDSSISQKQSDPQNLRGAAATSFAQAMAGVANAQAKISIELAIIGFSGGARTGRNSPVDLGQSGHDGVARDVSDLVDQLGAGTNFEAGLLESEKALIRMGAEKGKRNQRNFIIFLTDGEPNRSEKGSIFDAVLNPSAMIDAINQKVSSLVSELDVAMISIASGTDLNEEGIRLISNMAQPSQNSVYPDHKGTYIRADSEDDLEGLSQQLGQAISGCQ